VAPTARSRPSSRRRSVTCMKKLWAMLIDEIVMITSEISTSTSRITNSAVANFSPSESSSRRSSSSCSHCANTAIRLRSWSRTMIDE
jgi:hypothetical protein